MASNNGAMKLVAGNSNPALAAAIGQYLGIPLTKAVVRRFADMEVFVEIQENVRGADVFVDPVHVVSGQRPPDGIAHHHRCAAARLGAAHHGSDSVLRLRPAGSQGRTAHADLRQARRQSHRPCGRRSRADARSPRRPDPGLLRHSDRQSVCLAGDDARHPGALRAWQSDRRFARRRRRGTRARTSPSASMRRSPSSTRGASGPASPRSPTSSARSTAAFAFWSTTSSIPAAR